MTLLHLLAEGALAAAQLLALVFVTPAIAAGPARVEDPAVLERPTALHRLSTTVDVRLLGSLADVRVAQHLRNAGSTMADLGPRLPAIDEGVDALRVVRGGRAVELLANRDCGDAPATDHARLSDDEAIADALQLAPGQDVVVEAIASQPLVRSVAGYRVALPLPFEADEPRALLVDQDDAHFLLVLSHRRAPLATLVLRFVSGESEVVHLGAIEPQTAILIPLRSRAQLDDLAEGAIEIDLADGGSTYSTTLVAERVDAHTSAQARVAE